jgi:hypothetical protein
MKPPTILAMLFLIHPISGVSSAVEPVVATNLDCVDQIVSVAIVDPTLDSDFFRAKDGSYPFYIVEHEDGHLENTLGGEVSKEEATKIEHTAKCVSSHQGEHLMSFCDAQQLDGGGLLLEVAGGLPAYASALTLQIGKDKSLKCMFYARYPMFTPGEKLTWKITKKTFKMTSDSFKAGERLLGWLSVEFEETCTIDGKVTSKSHKIEGYVKPVIRKLASDSRPIGEQAGPERPLPTALFR